MEALSIDIWRSVVPIFKKWHEVERRIPVTNKSNAPQTFVNTKREASPWAYATGNRDILDSGSTLERTSSLGTFYTRVQGVHIYLYIYIYMYIYI